MAVTRDWKVLARSRQHQDVRKLYRAGDGFTVNKENPLSKGLFSKKEARAAVEWGDSHGYAVFATKKRYPFLVLDSDTRMVRHELASLLDDFAADVRRYVWIGEGWRTRARQEELWRQYVARNYAPPVVARPGTSNHETGNAADASVLHSGRGGSFTNVGLWPHGERILARHGLGLPVGGEPWHVQVV